MPESQAPGDTFRPATPEAERRSSESAPLCEDGVTRAMRLRRVDEAIPSLGLEPGDVLWGCMQYGVVYMPAIVPPLLAELLFPDDWSLVIPQG